MRDGHTSFMRLPESDFPGQKFLTLSYTRILHIGTFAIILRGATYALRECLGELLHRFV